ncbi:MAG: hypothetical protein GY903_26735 [Fuerstiella sp.]|nr:hypothetical protein [Fuerstiella sp.]
MLPEHSHQKTRQTGRGARQLSYATVLSMLVLLIIPALAADEPKVHNPTGNHVEVRNDIPLFGDLQFRRGFNLSYPSSTHGRNVAAVLRADGETRTPLWRLCQWGTQHSLADAAPILSPAGLRFENAAKRVMIAGSPADRLDLILDIRGGVEYGQHMRKQGEAWPHLLIEQDALERYPLTELSNVRLQLDLRLLSLSDNAPETSDPRLHSAQFQLFLVVKNIAEGSPDYRNFYWFGVPFFDRRYDFSPPHMARDQGKKHATGKFIYTIAGKEVLTTSMKQKRWVYVDRNLLPSILAGLREAVSRGYLKSDNPREYAVANMNLGWELPGNYDAAIQLRNLKLSVSK